MQMLIDIVWPFHKRVKFICVDIQQSTVNKIRLKVDAIPVSARPKKVKNKQHYKQWLGVFRIKCDVAKNERQLLYIVESINKLKILLSKWI